MEVYAVYMVTYSDQHRAIARAIFQNKGAAEEYANSIEGSVMEVGIRGLEIVPPYRLFKIEQVLEQMVKYYKSMVGAAPTLLEKDIPDLLEHIQRYNTLVMMLETLDKGKGG